MLLFSDRRLATGSAIVVAFIVLAGIFISRNVIRQQNYVTYQVQEGTIVEDILASGKVEGVTSASFSFKNQGKIAKINVATGDTVKVGQELLAQDTSSLDSQLLEMDAGIQLQRARINQLKAGSSNEEIDVVTSSASSASTALANAEKNLDISKQQAVDKLKDAYTVADNVIHNKVDNLFSNPQSSNPKLLFSSASDFKLGSDLEFSRAAIENELKAWNSDINSLSVSEDLTSHITITRRRLGIIKKFLDSCSLFINNPNNSPSSLQGSWDILRVDIAIGRASINASLSTMTDIEAMIIQSQTQIDNAKSTLKTATKQLQQTKASVRGTDLAVYQAQLEQAFAMKRKVESQRKDLVITAPFSGVVTDIVPKISEVVGPGENVVSLLSYDKLQIKVNIVENNIVKVKVGQVAKITFDAMAGKEFTGKVTAIDPAEKEINGTIYYQTTVTLEEAIDFLRPGMTATVWIISHEIQNALYIPASSLFKVGDTWNVKVVDRLGVKEKVVVPGYKDRKGMVQIVSGLSIGETVVLDDKNFYEME